MKHETKHMNGTRHMIELAVSVMVFWKKVERNVSFRKEKDEV